MRSLSFFGGAVLVMLALNYLGEKLEAARVAQLEPDDDCGCGDRRRHGRALHKVLRRLAELEADLSAHLDHHVEDARVAELRPDPEDGP
jgi:hypothetical protein